MQAHAQMLHARASPAATGPRLEARAMGARWRAGLAGLAALLCCGQVGGVEGDIGDMPWSGSRNQESGGMYG